MTNELICYHCGNNEISELQSWGYNYDKNGNRISRRWRCLECEKTFTTSLELVLCTDDSETLLEANTKLKAGEQKFRDINRIERKTFRNWARINNAIEDYSKALLVELKKNTLSKYTIKHEVGKDSEAIGIIHFTDAHFNEVVTLSDNKFNFDVARKRCKKFIETAKLFLKPFKIKKVLFAMTGDLINSDRRIDEMLSESGNRAAATFIASQIIEQMILDLNKEYNVFVASVCGNESRITDEIAWNDIVASDNYDFTIFNMLRFKFENAKGIEFLNGHILEQVVKVGNKNILLVHGHQIPAHKSPLPFIAQITRKYVHKGINVDFVLFGHFHEAYISDAFARGGSIVGGNEYSDQGLELTSFASQNIHILTKNSKHSILIDLQNCDDIEGYDISKTCDVIDADARNKDLKIFNINWE